MAYFPFTVSYDNKDTKRLALIPNMPRAFDSALFNCIKLYYCFVLLY